MTFITGCGVKFLIHSQTSKVWEWISDFTTYPIMNVITYPCWNLKMLCASHITVHLRCNTIKYIYMFIYMYIYMDKFPYVKRNRTVFEKWLILAAHGMCVSELWRYLLTHLPLNKTTAISQTIFSYEFSWMKNFVFLLRFHWSLFLRVQ